MRPNVYLWWLVYITDSDSDSDNQMSTMYYVKPFHTAQSPCQIPILMDVRDKCRARCENVHTGLRQGQIPGSIVSYCASPVLCTGPGPVPVQCEYTITTNYRNGTEMGIRIRIRISQCK